MSVQTIYRHAATRGIAGGIYDMHHYPVDTRYNEEPSGVLRCGVGVVQGTDPGSNVKLPAAGATAATFEGVVVNGFTNQHDLEGKVYVAGGQNVGVMRRGRIWVRVADDAEPAYGDALHMLTDGEQAGFFATEGGVTIPGRFIGGAEDGLAPVELDGTTVSED